MCVLQQVGQLIIRHDRRKNLRFAPLQSETGKKLIRDHHLPEEKNDSFILIKDNKAYLKSTAGLMVLKDLGGLFPICYLLIILPEPFRDFFYDILSRNRYKWWGTMKECMMPSEEIKDRFLQ